MYSHIQLGPKIKIDLERFKYQDMVSKLQYLEEIIEFQNRPGRYLQCWPRYVYTQALHGSDSAHEWHTDYESPYQTEVRLGFLLLGDPTAQTQYCVGPYSREIIIKDKNSFGRKTVDPNKVDDLIRRRQLVIKEFPINQIIYTDTALIHRAVLPQRDGWRCLVRWSF